MSEDQSIATGRCLCGAVRYQITGNLGIFQYCHCSRCRKFTGSAFAANLLVSPKQFEWLSGAQLVGRYELSEAKHFATGFCKQCGSSLPWLSQSGKAVIVPAGTLDEDPGIHPSQNVFSTSGADWYEEPHTLPHYDTLPGKK
ncbi:MAG: GFA family protein [Candidatus Thiodiazotropha sp. (ex. Lucinisca nassula)]|nr:GFA family protein [Candidatus Thiodiazotropha sp. (ex. Lucinisca nassula)]